MINLENADIAIQKKGRLTEGTLEWLNENAGTDFPVAEEPFDRRRELTDSSTGITVVGYSNGDTVKAVATGQTNLAICGDDMYTEKQSRRNLQIADKLGFGACKLVYAVNEEWSAAQNRNRENMVHTISVPERLATPYPRLASDFASRRKRLSGAANPLPIIEPYSGGIEMIGRRTTAPYVIDIVDTGESMAANSFRVLDTVGEYEAVLLERRYSAMPPNVYQYLEYIALAKVLSPSLEADDLAPYLFPEENPLTEGDSRVPYNV